MTRWSDGSTFSYNNFPALYSNDGCPYLRMDGVWGVGDCTNLTHVLCKRGKVTSLFKKLRNLIPHQRYLLCNVLFQSFR